MSDPTARQRAIDILANPPFPLKSTYEEHEVCQWLLGKHEFLEEIGRLENPGLAYCWAAWAWLHRTQTDLDDVIRYIRNHEREQIEGDQCNEELMQ